VTIVVLDVFILISCHHLSASSISDGSTTSAQHVWPSGIISCWPDDMACQISCVTLQSIWLLSRDS